MNTIMDDASMVAAKDGTTQPCDGPVLIVDDDPYDAITAEGVVGDLNPILPVQILTSGEDLIAYLQGENIYHDRKQFPYPGLVLLDLKMPRMDGFAVLQWLKNHPEHAKVPVVVLSGLAGMAGLVTKAYQLGAHSFLPKPVQAQDIQSVLHLLKISV